MQTKPCFLSLSALVLASGSAFAQQGADDPANAPLLTAGSGAFVWDTTNCSDTGTFATTGPVTSSCQTTEDVWFRWQATADTTAVIDLCGSLMDTEIAIWTGNPNTGGTELTCNDDSCSVQSAVTFGVTSGTIYYIQVGFWDTIGGTWDTGPGTITQQPPLPPPSGSVQAWLGAVGAGTAASYVNSNLTGPTIDDIGPTNGANGVTYEFVVYGTNAGVSSGLLGNLGSGVGASAGLKFEQYMDTMQYGVTAFGIADYTFAGNNTENTDVHLTFVANTTTNSTELFVNAVSVGTAPYAPVLQGTQGLGQIYRLANGPLDLLAGVLRGVAVYPARLSAAEILAHHDAYFAPNLGLNYCSPANVNTTGGSASIAATGTLTASANNLTLNAEGMPNNQFGFFINSLNQGFVPLPGGSQGNLCLSGAIGRYNAPSQIRNSGSTGSFSLILNLANTPTPSGPVSIAAGQTWYFQCWYRDLIPGSGPTSNFTDATGLTFQ